MSQSIEELLKIVQGGEESSPEDLDTVQDFVDTLNISKGDGRISNSILYYTYRTKYGGKMSKIHVSREMSRLGFRRARTGKRRSWYLNEDSFDLTREGKLRAEFYEKENKKK